MKETRTTIELGEIIRPVSQYKKKLVECGKSN